MTRNFRLRPHIASVSPSAGSVKGTSVVTISGGGFMEGAITLRYGSVPCTILSVTYSEITFQTTEFTGREPVHRKLHHYRL